MSFDIARNVQDGIRGILGSSSSSLTPVPEIQRDAPKDAIHKLQIQVFVLSDALAAAVAEIDRLSGRGR